jgi:murein DD-endopeptidase MepM/ murein hydrolase activator NlpD
MTKSDLIRSLLQNHQEEFHTILGLEVLKKGISPVDLSVHNPFLQSGSADALNYVLEKTRKDSVSEILYGGYAERRNLYVASSLFNPAYQEPRDVHLGTDIWADKGTEIFSPLGGVIHSMGFNDHPGDYGPTIIVEYQLDAQRFYCLYGHLSFNDLGKIREGQYVNRGELIGHLGGFNENGGWPPHLHFQIIIDLSHYNADYPGVCAHSEKAYWLGNSPDPELLINLGRFRSKA